MADITKKTVTLPSSAKATEIISGKRLSLTVEKLPIQMLEMEDVLFHHSSAVMMPEKPQGKSSNDGEDTNDSEKGKQEKVCGIKALALVFKYIEFYPSHKMLIAGHADTSGAYAINYDISRERATNILYLITGEANGKKWAEVCVKRHKVEDYQQILQFFASRKKWSCDPGKLDNTWGPKTEAACRVYFDATDPANAEAIISKIKGSSEKKWPPEAWEITYSLYEQEICATLKITPEQLGEKRTLLKLADTTKPVVGCGESFPIDKKEKNNYSSQTNRRVEILFFDPDAIPANPEGIAAIVCPSVKDRNHTTKECPLWNEYYEKKYIDPDDLFAEVYYLKFVYYDRIKDKILPIPDKLTILAFQNKSDDFSKAEELETAATYSDGIYQVKVKYKSVKDPESKSVHFEFTTDNGWVFSDITDASRPSLIVKKTPAEFAALPFKEKLQYYDLPSRWSSLNYRTLYDGKDEGTDSFQMVFKDLKKYRPLGDETAKADKPLVFSLDDSVLLDVNGGTQRIKDENHELPAKQFDLSATSRVKILTVNRTTGFLELFKKDPLIPDSSRIPFARNYIAEKLDTINNAKIISFRNGFYTIGHKRATAEPQWEKNGFVLGARAAVRSDIDHHTSISMKYSGSEFGYTGDYELHYFHHLYHKDNNPVSFLVTYLSICFMADTRESANGPVPSQAEVELFETDGIYNAMDHWNRKLYYYEEKTPGTPPVVLRPFFFFDEKETFRVAKPAGGFNIDFNNRTNHTAFFSHAGIAAAQVGARGGRPLFLAFICKDTNPATHWGPAWHWSIRDEGPKHYSLFMLNKSAGSPWPGQYPNVPVNEHAENYGAHTFAHELGHATGNPDEYIKKASGPVLDGLPDFDQYFAAYTMEKNNTSMMYGNGVPRLHQQWYHLHMINTLVQSTPIITNWLNSKQFVLRLDRGGIWDCRFHRHLDTTNATSWQKPREIMKPMHHAPQHQLISSPLKRLNLALHDVSSDESSLFNFHSGQTMEYNAVVLVRPLLSLSYSGTSYWTDVLRRDKAINLYWAWRNLDGHFRLVGGKRDIKNIYVTFLPGFSMDTTLAERNYTVDFQKDTYSSAARVPQSNHTVKVYRDIAATEVVQYMLNTSSILNTSSAIESIRAWVNSVLTENFTSQYF